MSPADLDVQLSVEPDYRPAAFTWQGTRWLINSIGRTWATNGEQHYLVMVQGDRVFELARSSESGKWRLVRRPEDFGPRRKAT